MKTNIGRRTFLLTSRYSSNVILAKARAMYGRSLKSKDYTSLMNCHSVGEVAAYLKNNTTYADVLSGINEATIHRGHLEQLLRRKLFSDYAALGRYDIAAGTQSFHYLVHRGEAEAILSCLRLIGAGRPGDILFAMPTHFASHTNLDLNAMSKCKSFGDLVAALEGTPYADVLRAHPPREDGSIPLTAIETTLYTRLTRTAADIISRAHGSARRELEDLLGVHADAQNINRILRLKRYFGASPDEIRAHLLPYGTLSDKVMERMIRAGGADEVMNIFLSTRLGKAMPGDQHMTIYELQNHLPYFSARRHIHFSPHPSVVMFSYIIIKDVELNDITNIIEGIRYGLSPEQIKSLLVPVS